MECESVPKPNLLAWTIASSQRCRWNVLDMITVVAREALPGYLFIDLDMSWAEQLRARLATNGQRVTVTAILLKAIGIAQRNHPTSRGVPLPFGRKATLENIVAGFTVEKCVGAQPTVFFGTIQAPDIKTLQSISSELDQFTKCEIAEHPQLNLQQRYSKMPWLIRRAMLLLALSIPQMRLHYLPATFGVTSLGKYEVKALLGPCVETSTFGVGALEDRPVVQGDQIVICPMLTLTLIFDYRTMTNVAACSFMQEVKALMTGGLESYLQECERDTPVLTAT